MLPLTDSATDNGVDANAPSIASADGFGSVSVGSSVGLGSDA